MKKPSILSQDCYHERSQAADGVRLSWVRHGTDTVHARTFANLAISERPTVFCPGCGEKVILKLGEILSPHAAHYTDAACPFGSNEAALHFEMKHHVADELKRASSSNVRLIVQVRCADLKEEIIPQPVRSDYTLCGVTNAYELDWEWDEVKVEPSWNGCKPDVLLLRSGKAVGVIEIFNTHAVSQEKASRLELLRIPWIEIRANSRIVSSYSPWTIKSVLPTYRQGGIPLWRCASHERAFAHSVESRRHSSRRVAARVVDVYEKEGSATRELWSVHLYATDGRVGKAVLFREDEVVVEVEVDNPDDLTKERREVAIAFRKKIAELGNEGAFVDSPMRWFVSADADRLARIAGNRAMFPHLYVWLDARRKWWQPADLKDVKWDGVPDSWGQHPAVTARQKKLWMRRMGITTEAATSVANEGQLELDHAPFNNGEVVGEGISR